MNYNITKRTACDRCRGQKLRCRRAEQGDENEPCLRCHRAGAVCFTSSPRPSGRPRTNGGYASDGRQPPAPAPAPAAAAAPQSETSLNTLAALGRRRRQLSDLPVDALALAAPSRLTSTTRSIGTTPAWAIPDGELQERLGALADRPSPGGSSRGAAQPWISPDMGNLFSMLLPNADDVLDPLVGLGTGDQARAHEAMSEEAPRYSHNGNRHGAIELGMDVDSEGAYDDAADGRDRDAALLSESPESGDVLINLARLMEMITIQIYRVRCHPKSPAGEYPCIDKIHETQENPAAQVLQSTSEFTGILERFCTSSSSYMPTPSLFSSESGSLGAEAADSLPNGPPLRQDDSCSANTGPVGTPAVLLILSCYLQLLRLYDAITNRMLQSLQQLQDVVGFFQTAIELRISGLPSIKGHLYIKVLVQIMEHQINAMEKLLGLPAEYRLFGRTASTGILSTVELSRLFKVVMAQGGGGPAKSGSSLVDSIRENLTSIKELLQG
ncbi:Zn(2)-Cys(6) zinc finger domain protein [Metarhizium robertsii]|uniref:Zn(2)-C6 fungal-type DNA-binding domain protein n=2 Tax=Metarhizium robertsii TaxID=568076 RepID=E9FCW8_METRA|nr:Zn(2)-C6 fungal-type DNA-binding domain protein [Metarhizium robertsii ARSEF 23]EFY94440.1 Zn(2)-C6 fungal-type DNA-binding domain protein [Metarhizium robertsii ARSEF 23]EXU95859.1 Zn(2)-Cys(6) zinc finger domain protein [Metarhizium robertsii]